MHSQTLSKPQYELNVIALVNTDGVRINSGVRINRDGVRINRGGVRINCGVRINAAA
jgi:hypothetical protein